MNRRTASPVFFLLIVGILLNGHVLLRAGLKNDRDRESQPIEDVTITVDADSLDGLDKAVALPAAALIDVDAAASFPSAFACGRQPVLILGDLLHQSVRLQI